MIRVELLSKTASESYRWRAACAGGVLEGRSHQPLLDACRALKRMGETTAAVCGLFWPDRTDWTLRTTIGKGAELTVNEMRRGFAKYKPYPSTFAASATGRSSK